MQTYLLTIQTVLVAVVLVLHEAHSFRWLGINGTLVNESSERDLRRYLCSSSPTASKNRLLDKEQKKICRRRTRMMKYVVAAAKLARDECLKLTKYERWDCRGILEAPKFTKDLRVGTRQAAFLHALSSAALVFAVTEGCARDKTCECGRKPSESLLKKYAAEAERKDPRSKRKTYRYEFKGCHDNIHHGIKFSKDFLDLRERRQNKPASRRILNLHNNDLGRKVAQTGINVRCRSSEVLVTGKTEFEVCLYLMNVPFSKISKELHDRYTQAQLVTEVKVGKSNRRTILKIKPTSNGVGNSKRGRKPKSSKMIYLHRSRDFCISDPNNPLKNPGTNGRVCAQKWRSNIEDLEDINPGLDSFNVCANLCCGREYRVKSVIRQLNCRCRFSRTKWGVVCKTCPVPVTMYICN